jgi:pteridine reductase
VVTGGAVRLGRAIVLALRERGAQVAFTYHSSDAAAGALVASDPSLVALKCDVSSEADVDAVFAELDARFGRLDLLVNNAAIFERAPLADASLASWQRHLGVNLTGTFLCSQRAAARMTAQGGVIVNVGCPSGLRPWPNYLAYSVSKAGVLALTTALAKALAPSVRVNAILPGPVLPPEDYDATQRRVAVERTLLKREGSSDDVVRAVLFAWDSDYTTGAFIPVDGGRSAM